MKNLNETKKGFVALNVVSDDKFLEINGVKIERKEYKGEYVLTPRDISKIHQREVREVNQNFKNLRNKMIKDEDYFEISKKKISEYNIKIKTMIPNNVKSIILFTSSGYLKLVKTFVNNTEYKIIKKVYEFLGGDENIDIYVSNLAIEYDEEAHKFHKGEDKTREEKIEKETGCKFIRCSYKDSNIKNLMKILKEIVF